MEGRLFLDVVVGKSAAVLELLAGEDQTLLVRRDALLVLDLGLDIVDGVRGLDLEGDRLTREAACQRDNLEKGGWEATHVLTKICMMGFGCAEKQSSQKLKERKEKTLVSHR